MENPEKIKPTTGDKHGLTLFGLPDEILLKKIAFKLDKTAISRWSQVDWASNKFLNDAKLWKFLIERDFAIRIQEGELPETITFKQCYRWLLEFEKLAQPQLNLLEKISQIQEIHKILSSSNSKDEHDLKMINVKTLIGEIQLEEIKEEILTMVKFEYEARFERRNILKPLFSIEFDKLLIIYSNLYEQGNLFASFNWVKLYVELYKDEEKRKWPVYKLDSNIVYEVALELIDKKFRELQLQKYIDLILDATIAEKKDEFKKKFILRENFAKEIAKLYSEDKLSLNKILSLPSQDLRLLQKVFLPMFITECNEKTEKDSYKKLFQDIEAEVNKMVDKNYKTLDSNFVQNMTEVELKALLSRKVENKADESSDSDVEDFAEDSDHDDGARADDQFRM